MSTTKHTTIDQLKKLAQTPVPVMCTTVMA